MPALTLRRSSHSSKYKPKLSKGAAIGGSIGGVYVVICVVVLILLMRRRKRRRITQEHLDNNSEANRSAEYVEYHDHLNGKAPPSRSLVVTPSRSLVITRSSYRPPTRRNIHTRSSSEGTVVRGGASNPFWMFNGIYEETESDFPQEGGRRRSHSSPQHRHSNSSPHHRYSNISHQKRYSNSTHHRHRSNSSPHRHRRTESDFSIRGSESFEIRPATAMSMQMHMPTSIFVTEMNARFPEASETSNRKSAAHSQIRQVPPSPSPSSSLFREIVESQEEGPIPPIMIEPLMRRSSIDRIVSGVREKSSEKEREGPELIRVGTLNKGEKRKIVHVARNKSVSALSEKFLSRMRKSRKGILEDA